MNRAGAAAYPQVAGYGRESVALLTEPVDALSALDSDMGQTGARSDARTAVTSQQQHYHSLPSMCLPSVPPIRSHA